MVVVAMLMYTNCVKSVTRLLTSHSFCQGEITWPIPYPALCWARLASQAVTGLRQFVTHTHTVYRHLTSPPSITSHSLWARKRIPLDLTSLRGRHMPFRCLFSMGLPSQTHLIHPTCTKHKLKLKKQEVVYILSFSTTNKSHTPTKKGSQCWLRAVWWMRSGVDCAWGHTQARSPPDRPTDQRKRACTQTLVYDIARQAFTGSASNSTALPLHGGTCSSRRG
ncbi:hypothetical protein BaRGS_00033327 [Batillaria attramentaria]|uniref:Secreted protein n=1 Tax=Batillaria attramentaria TaxID=370345 RepID=A0ABD0JKN5_9CAEN